MLWTFAIIFTAGISPGFVIGASLSIKRVAEKFATGPQAGKTRGIQLSLCGVGILFMVFGMGLGIYEVVFEFNSVRTSGQIVGLKNSPDEHGNSPARAPIFSFTDGTGVVHTNASRLFTDPPRFEVGQRVKVLYLMANPSQSKLDYFMETRGIATVFVILGIFLTSSGLLIGYFFNRQKSCLRS